MEEIKRFIRCFFSASLIDITLYLAITTTVVIFFTLYTMIAYTFCIKATTMLKEVCIVLAWRMVNVLYILFIKALLYIFWS